MKLSIIVPCYNEVKTIETIISSLKSVPYDNKEIILVDDCSTDGTIEIIENELKPLVNHLILHTENRGKGSAIRSGISRASGDIIVIQDADLEYDPDNIPGIIKPILDGKADVVYGSRYIPKNPIKVGYYWHTIGNKCLTALSNMCSNINLTDMETGYKAITKEVFRSIRLEESGFGIEPEITAKIAKLKCRVYEVGIDYNPRSYKEGKKIKWIDGIITVWCIIKYNLLRN